MIMLTSLGRREVKGERDEFAAFLNKPIKPSALFEVLVSIFTGRTTRVLRRAVTEEQAIDAQMGQKWPLRVLLAEDNATNQKLALRILARIGYRADVAANGLEAIEPLNRQGYAVVLMDVKIPALHGIVSTARH